VNTYVTILLYLLVISVLLALIGAARSVRLQNRFKRLGALKGRHVDDVIKIAGNPHHRVRRGPDTELLEWRRVGFHIALMFKDGLCEGADVVEAPKAG